jgi:hypothetical protein
MFYTGKAAGGQIFTIRHVTGVEIYDQTHSHGSPSTRITIKTITP